MQAAALPLFPEAKPIGRPDPDAAAVRARAGVEFFELDVRQVLNRCTNREMPFSRTINPYRGCEFGCTYCYARYTHSFFGLDRWQDFERKIYVKHDAARSLKRALRRSELQGQKIAIGTVTDPYQPAERHYGITRSLLRAFEEASGLDITITTRSPLVLRDLELLTRLDRQHSITVNVTITTLDSATARRIEPKAPEPEARLRTIRTLASEGIATQILCMPIMPGINSTETQLRPVFEAAAEYEAQDVVASPLFLRPAARKRFWPWLQEQYPQLESRYRTLYDGRDYLSDSQKERLLASFEALRMAYGFPRTVAGRG